MESPEPGLTSGPAPAAEGSTTPPLPPEGDRLRSRQVWAVALAAGVAAGLLSWLTGELVHGAFPPQTLPVKVFMTTFIQPTTATEIVAERKNATLAFAILGGVTGLALGFAGGLAGRSASRGAIVGLGAGALGALVGAVAAWYLVPRLYWRIVPDPNDFWTPLLVHGGIWAALGAVGGAAFGLGLGPERRVPPAIVGACIGAVLAAILFHLIAASLFPDSGSTEPNPSSGPVRLLARLLVTVLVAVGAAKGALGHVPVTARPAVKPEAESVMD